MADYVTRHNLISPFQSGFRTGYSTMTAFLRVSDDIRLNLELNLANDSCTRVGYAMDCFFLNYVNVMVFILWRRRLFHLIFFIGRLL
jgi:hypothetical protein